MNDVVASKIREAIPDIQERVFFSLTKMDEIFQQIDRLDYALNGPRHTDPECPDKPADKEKGAVEVLEDTTKELRQSLIDAETELRTRLDLLLGYKGVDTSTGDGSNFTITT